MAEVMSADHHVELHIPGATTHDLRAWASNITEANPITTGPTWFTPSVGLDITDEPFMGVELTFRSDRRELFTLALFAQVPNKEEREIMEADGVTTGGL